jgi:tRNA threonylcarbamoyladenosine biosynthesis protein TsaE
MRIERTESGLTINIDVASEAETEQVGRALAEVVAPGTLIGLVGPLGAGKTRLVRALAEALEVAPEAIASPTFVLIHEYAGRIPVVHADVYRLGDGDGHDDVVVGDEFDALGLDESYDGAVCLVEWADRVADRLPAGAWFLRLLPTGPQERRVTLELPSAALGRRIEAQLRGMGDV